MYWRMSMKSSLAREDSTQNRDVRGVGLTIQQLYLECAKLQHADFPFRRESPRGLIMGDMKHGEVELRTL